MIQSRTFHVKHYLELDVDEFVFKGVVNYIPESLIYRLTDNPYTKTLCTPEGFPLMVIGVVPVNVGVGEFFILPGKGWVKHTLEICKILKSELARLMMFHHRIQATCTTKDEKYARFLEMFGFQKEGVLRHYDNSGEDHYMYSVISGD